MPTLQTVEHLLINYPYTISMKGHHNMFIVDKDLERNNKLNKLKERYDRYIRQAYTIKDEMLRCLVDEDWTLKAYELKELTNKLNLILMHLADIKNRMYELDPIQPIDD